MPKIKIKYKFKYDPVLDKLENFQGLIVGVLMDVVSRTLLRSIQTRYTRKRSGMSVIDEDTQTPKKITPRQEQNQAARRAALSQAALERSNMFQEVISLIANKEFMQVDIGENFITLGAGYIPALDEIKAASATPILFGIASNSPYNILWRQMEFGMGVTKRKDYPGGIAATTAGSHTGWWYGVHNPKAGIHFKGTKPGDFLRDRSGAPYSTDGAQFQELFTKEFRRVLGMR